MTRGDFVGDQDDALAWAEPSLPDVIGWVLGAEAERAMLRAGQLVQVAIEVNDVRRRVAAVDPGPRTQYARVARCSRRLPPSVGLCVQGSTTFFVLLTPRSVCLKEVKRSDVGSPSKRTKKLTIPSGRGKRLM